jgi:hypothetical protein
MGMAKLQLLSPHIVMKQQGFSAGLATAAQAVNAEDRFAVAENV